jgi:hypothetical protein
MNGWVDEWMDEGMEDCRIDIHPTIHSSNHPKKTRLDAAGGAQCLGSMTTTPAVWGRRRWFG